MIVLDRNADTFPVGLAGTPFEEVYRALRTVAATVWDVDPLAYRAGMAWGWYALHDPAALTGFRDVVVAALISAMAPVVKDTQTDAELVEYLRQWRSYTPTFPKLQAIYALFGAVVDIQPVSDPESQAVLPVDDTRLAFYIRIESVDFSRPLTLAEAREIAVRATPLGSRPYPYYALETRIPCTVSPAPVGIYIRLENWETARPPAPPQQLGELVFVDASGDVVYSVESLNEMEFAPTGYFTIDDSDDVVFVEESPYPARGSLAKNYTPNVTIADGSSIDTGLPYYSQKLYIPVVVWHDENWNLGTDYFGWDLSDSSGSVYATNNTGSSRIVISIIVAMIDATDAEVVEVKSQSDAHFHAFKWTSNGTPYWYVVDGDEDWTDDLQAEGYEEVPSIVLPTVSEITVYTDSSDHYFQFNVTNQTTLITATYTYDLYLDQACTSPFVYDSSSLYLLGYLSSGTWKKSSVQTVADMPSSTTSDISSSISAQVLTSSGKLWLITNYTGTLHDGGYQWSKVCKVCSSNQATVVTVYNSSNVAYNAFKFTASGTDYYYVLDGVQTDWTDDLAGIGYHLPVVLPTVNREAGAVAIYPNHANFNTNDLRVGRVWDWDTSAWVPSTYDVTKTYAAVTWHCENDFDGYYGVEISKLNNSIGITNVLPFVMTKYIESVYATCDSLNVSIVKVYDTNNSEYNAFAYSTNGTNYYYVLDYVQNDWTDDLSTLGYSLTPNITNTLRLAVSLDANNEPEADTFEGIGWYWWSRVPDEATKNLLIAEGLWYDSGYAYGSAKYSSGGKTLVLTGVFTDAAGTSLAPGWNKAFTLRNNASVAALYTLDRPYTQAVKTYRVTITTS